jgi:enoyl-CoA hydratase
MADQPAETIDALVAGRTEEIAVLDVGATRLLVFNRPEKRNAMTSDMRRNYAKELAKADADPDVHCLIVTGAHGFFTAGVDIKERPPAPGMAMIRPHPVEANRALSKPLIAVIDGPCITGGLELALSCTFVIGSDRSSYADTHLKLGILPGWGGVSLLATAIGARRAAQMQLSGERISAEKALAWGLINEVVSAERLLARCLDLAQIFASLDTAKRQAFIELNRRIDGLGREDALAQELVEIDRLRGIAANMLAKKDGSN